MEEERMIKKCPACGGTAIYVRDVHLKNDLPFSFDYFDGSLYRCPACGHFDFYEREEDRQARIRARESRERYEGLPDYRCPACGQVGKSERCIYCGMSCIPVKGSDDRKAEEAPEPAAPERKKKRRWFGGDDDKPDWEG